MKQYILNLKGTKKNNTEDIQVIMNCNNKHQAFNLAYEFFEKGKTNTIYGSEKTGLFTIHKFIPNADELRNVAGKYKVYKSAIVLNSVKILVNNGMVVYDAVNFGSESLVVVSITYGTMYPILVRRENGSCFYYTIQGKRDFNQIHTLSLTPYHYGLTNAKFTAIFE